LEKNLPIVHLSTQTDMDCPGIELGIFGEKWLTAWAMQSLVSK
jgi:hypothetical protein